MALSPPMPLLNVGFTYVRYDKSKKKQAVFHRVNISVVSNKYTRKTRPRYTAIFRLNSHSCYPCYIKSMKKGV